MDFNKILFEFNTAVHAITSEEVEICEQLLMSPFTGTMIVGQIRNSFTRKLFVYIKKLNIQYSKFDDCQFCENKDKLFVEINALKTIFNWLVANEVSQFGSGNPAFTVYKGWRVAVLCECKSHSSAEMEGTQFLIRGCCLN